MCLRRCVLTAHLSRAGSERSISSFNLVVQLGADEASPTRQLKNHNGTYNHNSTMTLRTGPYRASADAASAASARVGSLIAAGVAYRRDGNGTVPHGSRAKRLPTTRVLAAGLIQSVPPVFTGRSAGVTKYRDSVTLQRLHARCRRFLFVAAQARSMGHPLHHHSQVARLTWSEQPARTTRT